MSVLAVVLACLACTGDGRRVRMSIQGPSGFRDFTDGPVSGFAGRGDSEFDDMRDTYGRRGRSQFNDARHRYVRRGNAWSDDSRGEYGRQEKSRFDDIRGEYGRRGNSLSSDIRRSELDNDFRYGDGRRVHMTRRGRSLSQDFGDEYDSGHERRGSSLYDNVRGGYGRRGRSELENDFRFGDGLHGNHMTTVGSSGYADSRDGEISRRARRGNSLYDGRRSGYARTGRSEIEEDFRHGVGRRQVRMPSGGSSGYPVRTDENINEFGGARAWSGRRGQLDIDNFDDIDDLGDVHGRRLRRTHEGPQGRSRFDDY